MDCNHVLKDYLLQAAFHVGTTPMSFLKEFALSEEHTLYSHYLRLQNADARSRLGTAKKFLKIIRALVKQERVYMPEEWLDYSNMEVDEKTWLGFFDAQLKTLKNKWKSYDLSGIDKEVNQLYKEEVTLHDVKQLSKNL